jgi:hypothetical protein
MHKAAMVAVLIEDYDLALNFYRITETLLIFGGISMLVLVNWSGLVELSSSRQVTVSEGN